MRFLLSLQTLDERDARDDRGVFASTYSLTACVSTTSAVVC